MKLPLFFARRYLFSKKSVNAINIISYISLIGVLVSSAALIILLSFFNGMENMIVAMYSKFTPEFRIEPAKGKLFSTDDSLFTKLREDKSLHEYSEILQEKVLLQFGNHQFIAQLKGIEQESIQAAAKDSLLYSGEFTVLKEDVPYAVIGANVQLNLGVSSFSTVDKIEVFSPKKGVTSSLNPMEEFNIRSINPIGVLKYQQDFDNQIIVPISFAQEVLGEYAKVSAIEFNLAKGVDRAKMESSLREELPASYILKNREQQNPTLYRTVKTEKWAVYFILTLIGVIAIFNIIGSLTMLVIDKKKDMVVLRSLGAERSLIQNIFFYEGIMISISGCIGGLIIGYLFCLLQDQYGIIRLEEGVNSLLDAYPVDIRLRDFAMVFATISVVSISISYISARLSIRQITSLKD